MANVVKVLDAPTFIGSVAAAVPIMGLNSPGANCQPTSIRMTYTACAKVGTRAPQIIVTDGTTTIMAVQPTPTLTAGQTRTYQFFPGAPRSAAFVDTDKAYAPLPLMNFSDSYVIKPNDAAAIAANFDWGISTAATATTLTNSAATWTVNAWTGYTVDVTGATAVVTSNTATVLTMTGGWSQLVAGTAESSTALSMTDSDATWITDAWTGFTVSMGGSTAQVTSNTATSLIIGGWSPLAPTTGAYTIYGGYALYGDTVALTASYNVLNRTIV